MQIIDILIKRVENENAPDLKETLHSISDCFAIQELENTIGALSNTAPFNTSSRMAMNKRQEELEEILSKYGIIPR